MATRKFEVIRVPELRLLFVESPLGWVKIRKDKRFVKDLVDLRHDIFLWINFMMSIVYENYVVGSRARTKSRKTILLFFLTVLSPDPVLTYMQTETCWWGFR